MRPLYWSIEPRETAGQLVMSLEARTERLRSDPRCLSIRRTLPVGDWADRVIRTGTMERMERQLQAFSAGASTSVTDPARE
jgi:hypothetical protein